MSERSGDEDRLDLLLRQCIAIKAAPCADFIRMDCLQATVRRRGARRRLNYGHPWDARLEAAMEMLGDMACLQPPYTNEVKGSAG